MASVAWVWVGPPWQLPVGICLRVWPFKWGSVPHPQIELFLWPILSSCYLSYSTYGPWSSPLFLNLGIATPWGGGVKQPFYKDHRKAKISTL